MSHWDELQWVLEMEFRAQQNWENSVEFVEYVNELLRAEEKDEFNQLDIL